MLFHCTGHAVDVIEPLSIAVRLGMPSGVTGAGMRKGAGRGAGTRDGSSKGWSGPHHYEGVINTSGDAV